MATNVKRKKKKAEVMAEDGSMTLTGHLKELRNRLIICAAVFVVGVIGFLAISDKLIDLLTAMAMNANYTFVFLAPQEKLMQYFRVSLLAAVVVTVPVALYQVYAFAKPNVIATPMPTWKSSNGACWKHRLNDSVSSSPTEYSRWTVMWLRWTRFATWPKNTMLWSWSTNVTRQES